MFFSILSVGIEFAFYAISVPTLPISASNCYVKKRPTSHSRKEVQRVHQRPEYYAMFLRNLIFYAVAGSVLWVTAQRLGAGIGVALAASLLVPPLALLSYTLYKNRGPLL